MIPVEHLISPDAARSLRTVRVHDLSVPGNLSRVSWKLSRTVLRGGTNSNVGPLLGELSRGLVSDETVRWARARYADYLAGKVSEDDMCAEMVTMNRGLAEAEIVRAAVPFFEEKIAEGFSPT